MDALTYLKTEIKSYFEGAEELLLGRHLANQPRFNFYFTIPENPRHLLYLNWDGDEDGFTIKCLEFTEPEVFQKLVTSYPDSGSRVFNVGQPRSAVSFRFKKPDKVQPTTSRGILNAELQDQEIPASVLLECIDPMK